MACRLQINGRDIDQATLRAILRQFANDPTFKNIIMFDNYMRMTKDESEVTSDVINFISQMFNIPPNEVQKNIQAEYARRENEGIIVDQEKIRRRLSLSEKFNPTKIKNFFKKIFSNKGIFEFYGKEGAKAFEQQQNITNSFNRWALEAQRKTAALNNVLTEYAEFLTPEDLLSMTKILQGKGTFDSIPFVKLLGQDAKKNALANKLSPALDSLRTHIDGGSKLLRAIPNLLNKLQVDIYMDNDGKYTTLVYEAHRDPNWALGFEKMNEKGFEPFKKVFDQATNKLRSYFQDEKKLNERLVKIKKASLSKILQDIQQIQAQDPKRANALSVVAEKLEKDINILENRIKEIDNALATRENLQFAVVNLLKDMYQGDAVTNLYTPTGQKGGIGKSIFKKRKNIPQEIKDLFGEIKDPIGVYTATMSRILAVAQNALIQHNLADLNDKLLDAYYKDPQNYKGVPPMLSIEPINSLGVTEPITLSDSFSVLADRAGGNKFYTTPEFLEYMKDFEKSGGVGGLAAAYSALQALNSVGKIDATILNIPTQERNIIANLGKLISVTLFSPYRFKVLEQLGKSIYERSKMEIKDLYNIRNGKKSFYSNEYQRYENVLVEQGIKGSSVEISDLQLSIKNSKTAYNWLSKAFNFIFGGLGLSITSRDAILQKGSKYVSPITNLGKFAFRVYAAGDDVVKEALFIHELNNESNNYFKKSYPELIKEGDMNKIRQVENNAGRKLRETMPNYANSYEVSKWLQSTGLSLYFSPFLPFRLEQIRTSIGLGRIIREEITNMHPDPEIRKRIRKSGVGRLVGAIALVGMSTNLVLNLLMNDLDDEEEEFIKKWFVDEYIENPVISKTREGYVEITDASSTNLYGSLGMVDSALGAAITYPEDAPSIFGKAILQFLAPAIATQIGSGSLYQAFISGEDSFGRKIYLESDTELEKTLKKFEYIANQVMTPGTFKSLSKIDKKKDNYLTALATLDIIKKEHAELISETTDAKKIAKSESRLRQADREVDRLRLEAQMEKEAFFPGVRYYIKDPAGQLPNKIYNAIKIMDSLSADYTARIKEETELKKSEAVEIKRDLQKKYRAQLKKVKEYYEESKSAGYDVTDLIKFGILKGEGTDKEIRVGIFNEKEKEFILGVDKKGNPVPPVYPELTIKAASMTEKTAEGGRNTKEEEEEEQEE